MTWLHSTNITQVLDRKSDLWLGPIAPYSTKPSLGFLRNSDEGAMVIKEVAKNIQKSISLRSTPPPIISSKMIKGETVIEDFVDVDALAHSFFASGKDLFSYILQYGYNKPQSLERRVEYYTEITQTYYEQLEFTDQWSTYQGIDYPLIYQK